MHRPRGCPLSDGDTKSQREVSVLCNCESGDGVEKRKPVNITHYLEFSQSEIMFKMSRSVMNMCSDPGVSTRTT